MDLSENAGLKTLLKKKCKLPDHSLLSVQFEMHLTGSLEKEVNTSNKQKKV